MHESGMEAEEIQQAPACKFPRVGNGRNDSSKIGSKGVSDHYPDDEEDGELNRAGNVVPGSDAGGNANRLRGWNHSRIIRVSRASGGKDRHSKVCTSKGLRDRRVRLSVTSAIQFYDLQDRPGYDQPSKAVEWLIKAAADAIAELPSLNSAFPDTPKQLSDEKRASGGTEQGFDSAEVELDGDPNFQQNQSQHLSLSKSACSSTSETSKGSGLSLSRSEIRVKARERARERVAKEKQKENDSGIAQNVNHISHNASFTELLTDGVRSVNNNATLPIEWNYQNPDGEPNLLHKAARQWSCAIPMDYSESGLLGPSSGVQHSSRFSGHVHLGNSIPQAMTTSAVNANSWDRMKCFKASSPGIEFCPSSTNKLFPGVCLVPNGAVQGLCHGEDRKWFTRGCPRNIGWLALVGLITFCIMFFSPGMGIVPGIFNPEISLMYRGICGGIAATANWISNLIVPQSVLTLTHAFESSWTFLIFLAISVVALFFSLINVPETKGLPI
ncbi:hypothetical protein I3843_09G116700 [Carya illinoinensis]|uniref:uncharacterized protein LOC122277595 n=1 Tax=Carya illinoinensis TaxID=32201 RepID=UPI001BFB7FA5|nr:uncharacterized protein LOC122277595 [Carya illinoinensis]KAG2688957.1 hypothetical protein I3760_09G117200 [Carya illinoinensis]KAG7963420.1 hypothetical protein I3843_09G116700 [Carya illinoinensis]